MGLQKDKPPLYGRKDYLQSRKRWRLLLRNVNFLLDHKRTHNMKGLIRSHVHFNKCRTQAAALYTASSLHYVRFSPHNLCTKQSGLHNHAPTVRDDLRTSPASSLRDPVTSYRLLVTRTTCSDPPVFLPDLTRNNLLFVQECGTGNATISITGPNIYYYSGRIILTF